MEFSVLNESSLHNTLKVFYATKTNGQMEVNAEGHIYDVVGEDGHIYEIQTKNLGKLCSKIQDTLEKGYKVTLVHPLVITTKIVTEDKDSNNISSRKSPKKGHILDLFNELRGIYPVLLHKNFQLEVFEVNIIEHRLRTAEKIQSKNKMRRMKKDWIKTNKRLDEILKQHTFNSKEDYFNLLPDNLPESFCAKDLAALYNVQNKELSRGEKIPSRIIYNTNLIIWIMNKMELLEFIEVKNRSRYYSLKK